MGFKKGSMLRAEIGRGGRSRGWA